jgi:hypothetical protein
MIDMFESLPVGALSQSRTIVDVPARPQPGRRRGPRRITFSRAWRKSSCPGCSITCFSTERWKVKSNSSSDLWAGNRAARIRSRPPEHSREEIAVESSASANRS